MLKISYVLFSTNPIELRALSLAFISKRCCKHSRVSKKMCLVLSFSNPYMTDCML